MVVSTWVRVRGRRGGFRRDAFNLAAVRPSRTIPGILCEKGKEYLSVILAKAYCSVLNIISMGHVTDQT